MWVFSCLFWLFFSAIRGGFNSKTGAELTSMQGGKNRKRTKIPASYLFISCRGGRGGWKGEREGRGLFRRVLFSQISLAASLCGRIKNKIK